MERTEETLKARVRETPLLDRLNECQKRIGNMCAERRAPRMCIPVQHSDDDFFICTTLADAQATVEALQAQVKGYQTKTYCAFCGQTYDIDTGAELIARHIKECPKHPMRDVEQQVEALQRERDALEAKCLEEHVTIEQADAKVMKLEGEKGMWANERRDLLTQLENAESQLSQLRALVREIKKEFDNCTHECERCGESDPLTTFDIYRTVAKAATLDAMTPAGGQG